MDYTEFYGKVNIGHNVSQRNIMAREKKNSFKGNFLDSIKTMNLILNF